MAGDIYGPGRLASCRVVTSLQFLKKEKRRERNGVSAKSNKANHDRRRCAFVYAMGTLSGAEEMDVQVKYWFVSAPETVRTLGKEGWDEEHWWKRNGRETFSTLGILAPRPGIEPASPCCWNV